MLRYVFHVESCGIKERYKYKGPIQAQTDDMEDIMKLAIKTFGKCKEGLILSERRHLKPALSALPDDPMRWHAYIIP